MKKQASFTPINTFTQRSLNESAQQFAERIEVNGTLPNFLKTFRS